MARGRVSSAVVLAGLAVGGAACPPAVRLPVDVPAAPPRPFPPEGPGEAEPRAEPDFAHYGALEALMAEHGWLVLAARPLRVDPASTVVTAMAAVVPQEGGEGAWAFLPGHAAREGGPPFDLVGFGGSSPSLPVWSVEPAGASGARGLVVVADLPATPQDAGVEGGPAAYRLDLSGETPRVDLLWEALEAPDAVALVPAEGPAAADVVAARWYDSCPDPMLGGRPQGGGEGAAAAEGGSSAGAGGEEPCLIVRVWSGEGGLPQTYRTAARPDGRLAALGDERLDRAIGLLEAADCPWLDLRALTMRRADGLLEPGTAGELLEGIVCGPLPGDRRPATASLIALFETPDGAAVPRGEVVSLAQAAAASEGGRWSDGYRLLPDLGTDGVADWLWIARTDAGARYVVAEGPSRGRIVGSFFVGAGGDVVDRLVVPPPGGRVTLESMAWRGAPEPAAVLQVRVEASNGVGRIRELVLPLDAR